MRRHERRASHRSATTWSSGARARSTTAPTRDHARDAPLPHGRAISPVCLPLLVVEIEAPRRAQVGEAAVEPVAAPPQREGGQVRPRDRRRRPVEARHVGDEPRLSTQAEVVEPDVGVIEPTEEPFVEAAHRVDELAPHHRARAVRPGPGPRVRGRRRSRTTGVRVHAGARARTAGPSDPPSSSSAPSPWTIGSGSPGSRKAGYTLAAPVRSPTASMVSSHPSLTTTSFSTNTIHSVRTPSAPNCGPRCRRGTAGAETHADAVDRREAIEHRAHRPRRAGVDDDDGMTGIGAGDAARAPSRAPATTGRGTP